MRASGDVEPADLARFRAGDDALFAALVAEHSPRLLGAALVLTRDRALAHELVHDTWVQAFAARATFDARGSLLGWLLTVQRTCHLGQQRREARHAVRLARAATHAVDDGAVGGDPLATLPSDDGVRRALDALATLPPRQRDVVVARVLEDRSVADTARRLGVAEGTVKSTLAQALRRLRLTLTADR